MRLVNIQNITPDMTLARTIYNKYNSILLYKGQKNLHLYRKRLQEIGINYIYVNDRISEDIEVNDIIKSKTRQKSIKTIQETFKKIEFNQDFDVKKIKKNVIDITDEILDQKDILINMVDLKSYDTYTFSHSVNVTILAIMLGKALNYPRNKLVTLGMGTILHDIGKTRIPEEILNKKEKLSKEEFNIIKQHPRLGYEFLKSKENEISPVSRIIVLAHHERINGSGYPDNRKNKEIHDFARITAITDVFDALSSDRIYREKWPIYQTVEYLKANSYSFFDANYVNEFIKNLAVYPNGTMVLLNNGKKAIVKKQNRAFPTRPVIKLLDNKGKITKTINLRDNPDITITETCQVVQTRI